MVASDHGKRGQRDIEGAVGAPEGAAAVEETTMTLAVGVCSTPGSSSRRTASSRGPRTGGTFENQKAGAESAGGSAPATPASSAGSTVPVRALRIHRPPARSPCRSRRATTARRT